MQTKGGLAVCSVSNEVNHRGTWRGRGWAAQRGGEGRLSTILRQGTDIWGVLGGVLCCILSPGWISNIAPFQSQAQKGLRCNRSAMGL